MTGSCLLIVVGLLATACCFLALHQIKWAFIVVHPFFAQEPAWTDRRFIGCLALMAAQSILRTKWRIPVNGRTKKQTGPLLPGCCQGWPLCLSHRWFLSWRAAENTSLSSDPLCKMRQLRSESHYVSLSCLIPCFVSTLGITHTTVIEGIVARNRNWSSR